MQDSIFPGKKKFHFIGIGGIGMSALAKALRHLGFEVTGSDAKNSPYLEKMRSLGIRVSVGHDALIESDVDACVFSTAVRESNPEVQQAKKLGIPLLHRSEVLAEFLNKRPSIGITGTHGKTTTSAMVSFLTHAAGLEPTCLVGGVLLDAKDNVLLGSDNFYVAEVDESDKSHRRYSPLHSIITNVEREHLDHYRDFAEIKECFRDFGFKTRAEGFLVLNWEDEVLRKLFRDYPNPVVTYGFSHEADFWAHDICLEPAGSEYTLYRAEQALGRVRLSIPGIHNVSNSLAALGLLISMGLEAELLMRKISDFHGTGRRLEIKLKTDGLLVVDDYAHHPTEIQASLRALKNYGRKVTVVFQPHRFSRVQSLLEEFSSSFTDAERVILTDIYSAGENNEQNISASEMLKCIQRSGHADARYIEKNRLLETLEPTRAPEGDIFAFMGAGDIGEIADAFAIRFKS